MSQFVTTTLGIGRLVDSATVVLVETTFKDIGEALRDGVSLQQMERLPERSRRSLAECTLCAPIPRPRQIWALGLAYLSHVEETKRPRDAEPFFFPKAAASVIASGEPIVIPNLAPSMVDYEGEVALVIGRMATNILPADAWSYVAGITICNDVSARDVQAGGNGVRPNVSMAKSFNTFSPMGPCVSTLDEFPDTDDIGLRTYVDGELRQNTRTSELMRPVGEVLAYLTARTTLYPGDIVSTGTPAGIGHPTGRFLRAGSTVRIEVEHVGALENPVRAEGSLPELGAR